MAMAEHNQAAKHFPVLSHATAGLPEFACDECGDWWPCVNSSDWTIDNPDEAEALRDDEEAEVLPKLDPVEDLSDNPDDLLTPEEHAALTEHLADLARRRKAPRRGLVDVLHEETWKVE